MGLTVLSSWTLLLTLVFLATDDPVHPVYDGAEDAWLWPQAVDDLRLLEVDVPEDLCLDLRPLIGQAPLILPDLAPLQDVLLCAVLALAPRLSAGLDPGWLRILKIVLN